MGRIGNTHCDWIRETTRVRAHVQLAAQARVRRTAQIPSAHVQRTRQCPLATRLRRYSQVANVNLESSPLSSTLMSARRTWLAALGSATSTRRRLSDIILGTCMGMPSRFLRIKRPLPEGWRSRRAVASIALKHMSWKVLYFPLSSNGPDLSLSLCFFLFSFNPKLNICHVMPVLACLWMRGGLLIIILHRVHMPFDVS